LVSWQQAVIVSNARPLKEEDADQLARGVLNTEHNDMKNEKECKCDNWPNGHV
jgi:hypothetical protein